MDGTHGSFGGGLHVTAELKIASSSSHIQMARSEEQPTGLQAQHHSTLKAASAYRIQLMHQY